MLMDPRQTAVCLAAAVLAAVTAAAQENKLDAPRPNILWITAEDMSPHLGCYGDAFATTPHLDAFAARSVRYTQAFATAPVCSPARSCLITGVYATSLGTQRLRSAFPIPKEFRGFPAYLRKAGYFTSNNVKTDYNIAEEQALIRDAWDQNGPQAHWRQRKKGQPFFSVFNLMTTHQSRTSVWPFEEFEQKVAGRLSDDERHDPAKVPLPPYYPDTPLVRKTVARYYDCIAVMDKQVRELLDQLEADGLADETIVFFYSDHGMGMPRGKRLLHDSGMRVPLIVHFPQKYRQLAPAAAGATTDRLVSFVDFPPTVLSLAGVPIPEYMQGKAFLGPHTAVPRDFVYGARDRVDEVFELSRSVRNGRYLYIRNFMPHLSWMPPERYSDNAAMRREMTRLRKEGKLNAAQLTYAAPRKPVEEFYDTEADPHQIHNLADAPEQQERIQRFRTRLDAWILGSRDLGFLTEPQIWARTGGKPPWTLRKDREAYPLAKLLAAAKLAGRPNAGPQQVELLQASHDGLSYWGAVGLHAAESLDDGARDCLQQALDHESISVRIEAAAALARHGKEAKALPVLAEALSHRQPEAVLHAVRSLELLGASARPVRKDVQQVLKRAHERENEGKHPCWMFVRFSAEALLEELE